MDPQEKIKNQAEHIKQFEQLIKNQKRQLTVANESLKNKNRELDALHYVWCCGGCESGVHRFDVMKDTPLTDEVVRRAERNTILLRSWYQNKTYRDRNGTYKKVNLRWRFALWLAGLTWKQFTKDW